MLPLVLVVDRPWQLPAPPGTIWVSLVATAVLCTAAGYPVYFRLLALAGATNLLLVTFLLPITSLLLGALLLGEAVTPRLPRPVWRLIGLGPGGDRRAGWCRAWRCAAVDRARQSPGNTGGHGHGGRQEDRDRDRGGQRHRARDDAWPAGRRGRCGRSGPQRGGARGTCRDSARQVGHDADHPRRSRPAGRVRCDRIRRAEPLRQDRRAGEQRRHRPGLDQGGPAAQPDPHVGDHARAVAALPRGERHRPDHDGARGGAAHAAGRGRGG